MRLIACFNPLYRMPVCAVTAAGFLLGNAAFPASASYGEQEMELVREIHTHIVETRKGMAEEKMDAAYSKTIPGTEASYDMVPIPGGEFLMGSPGDEEGRRPDEGPQHRVKISPFWMGKNLVTWDEFELFMYPDRRRVANGPDGDTETILDAVSHPTAPYTDMSFGMGRNGYPAISMTQHAARKYSQWLSAKTGHFYRLPTEAEWEYAARAGTTTPYFFGDDPDDLDDYAWYADNSEFTYQQIGAKKPNPWGLYDMHGHLWEWTLDEYRPDRYEAFADETAVNPWAKPETRPSPDIIEETGAINRAGRSIPVVLITDEHPRVVRGGSWADNPENLRSAARRASEPGWKMMDPQFPQSVWYHTNAQWLGFRLVRPREIPSPEEMYEYWNK